MTKHGWLGLSFMEPVSSRTMLSENERISGILWGRGFWFPLGGFGIFLVYEGDSPPSPHLPPSRENPDGCVCVLVFVSVFECVFLTVS